MELTKDRRGFTLIEILIVVGIIGLLASMVLVGLAPAQRRGRDARRLADLKEVQNALELYYNKCGYYPGTAQANSPCSAWSATSDWTTLTGALTGSSLGVNQIPNDPTSGVNYGYATNNTGSSYALQAKLEDQNNAVFNNNYNSNITAALTGAGITAPNGGCTSPYYCIVF